MYFLWLLFFSLSPLATIRRHCGEFVILVASQWSDCNDSSVDLQGCKTDTLVFMNFVEKVLSGRENFLWAQKQKGSFQTKSCCLLLRMGFLS
jgi:hypothetical protein